MRDDVAPTTFSTTASDGVTAAAAAAAAFETWIRSVDGAWVDPSVQHCATFGTLRGLAYTGSPPSTSKKKVATIPATIVLSSDFGQTETWDRDLAVLLWKECRIAASDATTGKNSTLLSGYIHLLTAGYWDMPPSMSPDSLRRWTADQKATLLESSSAGAALIDLECRQEAAWRRKYASLSLDGNDDDDDDPSSAMTWPQFQWAMEVVHSRAFCGVQTGGTIGSANNVWLPLLAPVVAAAVGYVYATSAAIANPSEAVLAGLAVAAVLPALFFKPDAGTKSAVLLPVVDSANHSEEADSTIVYDPLKRCFELSIGPGCLGVNTEGGGGGGGGEMTKQLYVNYGKKSDREWLLNYGFLPGLTMPTKQQQPENDNDEYRRTLAQAFLLRNPYP